MSKENKYRLALFLIGVFLVWVLLPKCSSDPKVTTPNHDTIYKQEQVSNEVIKQTLEELHVLKLKNDSLMKRKPIYVIRYKTKFDSLYLADTSCQSSLICLYNAFGDLNDLNDSIIANSSKRLVNDSILIKELNTKIGLKQSRVTIDSTRIVQLNDTIDRVKRRSAIKWFTIGFGSGAAAKQGVDLLSKVKS